MCVSVYVSVWVGVFSGDKIEKNEVGGTRGAFGGEERGMQGFCGEI